MNIGPCQITLQIGKLKSSIQIYQKNLFLENSFKFYIEFKERNDSNGEVFDSLKANSLLLSPNEKSKEFSNFISEIMDFCYSYSEVFESYVSGEKIDSYDLEFRNSMEKIYLKIQKFLNEE